MSRKTELTFIHRENADDLHTYMFYICLYIFLNFTWGQSQQLEYKYKRELKPIVKSTLQSKTRKRTYIYDNSNPLASGLPSMGLHRVRHD